MNPEFEAIELVKNEVKNRFEIQINGYFAFVNYKEYDHKVALVHTEAAPELKGTGAASALIEKTLQFIKDHQQTVLPYCSFVLAFINKNPEWKPLVDKSFAGHY